MILLIGNLTIILLSKFRGRIKLVMVLSILIPSIIIYFLAVDMMINFSILIFFINNVIMIYMNTIKKEKLFFININLIVVYFSISSMLFSVIGLIINFGFIFDFEDNVLMLRNYSYEIFMIFSSFAPIYIFIILLIIPFKWIINFIMKLTKLNVKEIFEYNHERNSYLRDSHHVLALALILIFSMLVVFLPHTSLLNEENKSISVDTGNYGYTIKALTNNMNLDESFLNSFQIQFGTHPNAVSGDRPLTLLVMVILSKLVTMDLDTLIDTLIPLILSPLLVLSVYFLVKELTNNHMVSVLSAFLTAVSPQVLIGVYAGLFANWLALIICFFSFYGILKYLRYSHSRYLVILIILIITLRFTHVYTWMIMTPIMVVFSAILIMQDTIHLKSKIKKVIVFSLIFLIPLVLGSFVQLLINEENPSNNLTDSKYFFQILSFQNLVNGWDSLIYSVNVQNGGITANAIILILCIGWILYFSKYKMLSIFILVILLFSLLPIFFGNNVFQTRTIYNIPFQIPAAITLYQILRIKLGGKILCISILLCLIAVSLRFTSNLIFEYN